MKESQPFVLHTKGGDVTAIVNSADFIEDGSSRSHCVRAEVTVDMGVIRKDGGSGSEEGVTLLCDTLRESLRFEALSIGNPHAVARARDSLSLEDLANAVKEVGARVESSRPGGTNVQIFSVGKSEFEYALALISNISLQNYLEQTSDRTNSSRTRS